IEAPTGHPGAEIGTGKGTDQGQSQDENLKSYSSGPQPLGPVTVSATNINTSGDVNGGRGGDVTVTFNNIIQTVCGQSIGSIPSPETLTIFAGNGGQGGVSGTDMGSDQHEDQGENVGSHGKDNLKIGPVVVKADGTIQSGDARGGG